MMKNNKKTITDARKMWQQSLGSVLLPTKKTGTIAVFLDGSVTPDERDRLNRIKRDGASLIEIN